MKRVNNLYDKITNLENIMNMYNTMKKSVKNKNKISKFEDFYTYNIINIQNVLKNKSYNQIKYNIFLLKEPKYRIVMSQNIGDKLINHLVAEYFLRDVLDNSLIDTNVATRKNKGTHYGIRTLKKYLVELIKQNKTVYALKFDVYKYFYRIDHKIVMNLLTKKIKDKDALDLLNKLIESTDQANVNESITRLKNNEIIRINKLNISLKEKELKTDEINRIPFYEIGKGFPIGNMTSQIIAVYYLNELDHYIKEKLKTNYYIRYMDDGILLSTDKQQLHQYLKEIEKVVEKYKLVLNDKTEIVNVSKNGVDFLGFRFYIKNKKIIMKVRSDVKTRFKNKIKKKCNQETINSYKSHLKHGNCYNLFRKIVG